MKFFPKKNIIFEEFIQNPSLYNKKIFDFLGVSNNTGINYDLKENVSKELEPMDLKLRERLLDLYKDDVEELEKNIGKIWIYGESSTIYL